MKLPLVCRIKEDAHITGAGGIFTVLEFVSPVDGVGRAIGVFEHDGTIDELRVGDLKALSETELIEHEWGRKAVTAETLRGIRKEIISEKIADPAAMCFWNNACDRAVKILDRYAAGEGLSL